MNIKISLRKTFKLKTYNDHSLNRLLTQIDGSGRFVVVTFVFCLKVRFLTSW